jgi:hypothetical protein
MEDPIHKNNLRKNETETQIILANTHIFTVLLSSVRVINVYSIQVSLCCT